MGIYLNPGNLKFKRSVNSEIYVDKTELIQYTNKVIGTEQCYICMSRPRRFGKSMTANMLAAYYGRNEDSRELFSDFAIAQDPSFPMHLNQYEVLFLNMQEFLSRSDSVQEMLEQIRASVLWDLLDEYGEFRYYDSGNLNRTMEDIFQNTRIPFVVIIDEWDCIFREYKTDQEAQKQYLDFLRDMLKDKSYIALAYMTGILPIKKYGSHSALNMFSEFSMTNPRKLAEYVGFTEKEVWELCREYHMDMDEVKEWYDGYHFPYVGAIYNPRSVVEAMMSGMCDTYWNQTENFEALKLYIDMNFDGLKDDIIAMMNGKHVGVNTGSFTNDMATFHSKDDVLTLLIHLGYLAYSFQEKQVYIPNSEILNEYANAVRVSDWGEVSRALAVSRATLDAIWEGREEQVAKALAEAHLETSHLQYHDENALSYTISLALYVARNYYTVYRELPTGKGFADMVYLPRKAYADRPALVVELKWDQSAEGALAQIKRQEYSSSLKDYQGNILLVGVNYDRKTRVHTCVIEKAEKPDHNG